MFDFLRRLFFTPTVTSTPASALDLAAPTVDEDAKASSSLHEDRTEGVERMEATEAVEATKEQLEADLTQEYLGEPPAKEAAHVSTKQPTKKEKKKETLPVAQHEFVTAEMNLEVIGYFTASYKRHYPKPKEKRTVTLSHGRVVSFISSAAYGDPNAEDMDFYRAFQKIYVEYLEEHPNWTEKDPIVFSTSQLLRYAERIERGRDWKAAHDWVHRQALTGIEGAISFGRKNGYAKGVVGGMFSRGAIRGEKLPDGTTAPMNYVWLSDWFAANLRKAHYITLADLTLHNSYKTAVAKALTPILFFDWHASRGERVTLRYTPLAQRLGLPPQKYLAKVKHQMDSGHKEMKATDNLAEWEYGRTKDGTDLTITYYPGKAYEEYRSIRRARHYIAKRRQAFENRQRPSLPPNPAEEALTIDMTGKTLSEGTKEARTLVQAEKAKGQWKAPFGNA